MRIAIVDDEVSEQNLIGKYLYEWAAEGFQLKPSPLKAVRAFYFPGRMIKAMIFLSSTLRWGK